MSFEKYTELLTKCFTTLDKDLDERVSARQKVERLLKGINTPDNELLACKAVISQNYRADFPGACAYFSQEVAQLHGGAQLENRKNRKWRISEVSTGRGRGGGRGRSGGRGRGRGRFGERGRGGGRGSGQGGTQGRGTATMINGIDVTDPTRSFQDSEWEALGYNGGKAYVMQARERISGGGRGRDAGRGRGGQRNASGVHSDTGTTEEEKTDTGRENSDKGGRHGRGFGRHTYGH